MKRFALVVVVLAFVFFPAEGSGAAGNRKCPEHALDLAAAYILQGMVKEAHQILDACPKDSEKPATGTNARRSEEERRAEQISVQRSLLREMLKPGGKDAFDLLLSVLSRSQGLGDDDAFSTVLWQKLVARYALREDYSAIGAYVLERSRGSLRYMATPNDWTEADDRAAAAVQLEEIERELARLEERSTAVVPPRESGSTAAAPVVSGADNPSSLTRLLEAPRIVPFREVALAPAFKPIEMKEEDQEARAEESLKKFSFPENFSAVRAERQGDDVVAIGASQDYDPVGEISRGAYWVLRSRDGGKTWGKAFYTGLRIQAPYVVMPLSDAPLLAGDCLQIEVMVRELDQSSITFPPVGLRAKREQKGLLLIIPFAALERDSDADGLTDLAEERLITDPSNPDTDGDGLPDGSDPLPQVPWVAVMEETSRALAAVLERISGMKSMALIHEIGAGPLSIDDVLARAKRATLGDERTTFIVGDRRDFRSLLTSRRAIVLTPGEHELAVKKFGPIYATEMPLFVLDHAQRRGYVVWDASWVGGSLILKKVGDDWTVEMDGYWIT